MTGTRRGHEFAAFAGRSVLVHTLTYLGYGLAARLLFDYDALWREPGMAELYRPMESNWVLAGPLLQPLRGLLFAVVLWPLRDALLWHPLGWLPLWGIFVGFAILGTAAAAPGSLEGVIYTTLPLRVHLAGLPELLAQTLSYAWLLHHWERSAVLAGDGTLASEGPVVRLLKGLVVALLAFLGSTLSGVLAAWWSDLPLQALRALPGVAPLVAGVFLLNLVAAVRLGQRLLHGMPVSAPLAALLFYGIDALVPALFNQLTGAPIPAWWTLLGGLLPAGLAWAGTWLLWRPARPAVQWA